MISAPPGVFAEINAIPIADLWRMLGLPGEPKQQGNMHSPFHEDRHPSFSIHSGGMKWKDWSGQSGEMGGDGVAFVMAALRCDHADVRRWWLERHGLDVLDGEISKRTLPQRPVKEPESPRLIEWSEGNEPFEVTPLALDAFAKTRGLSYKAVHVAQAAGMLRFLKIGGKKCFCITDSSRRAAEIRAIDGSLFNGKKAFPLPGVRKDWLVGLAGMEIAPRHAGVFIAEGSTDTLTALALYVVYKSQGGTRSWIIAGMLGAGCKRLCPEAEAIIRGRHVRLCPDGDPAGDAMGSHWEAAFKALGCDTDVMLMPRESDLSDMARTTDHKTLATKIFG